MGAPRGASQDDDDDELLLAPPRSVADAQLRQQQPEQQPAVRPRPVIRYTAAQLRSLRMLPLSQVVPAGLPAAVALAKQQQQQQHARPSRAEDDEEQDDDDAALEASSPVVDADLEARVQARFGTFTPFFADEPKPKPKPQPATAAHGGSRLLSLLASAPEVEPLPAALVPPAAPAPAAATPPDETIAPSVLALFAAVQRPVAPVAAPKSSRAISLNELFATAAAAPAPDPGLARWFPGLSAGGVGAPAAGVTVLSVEDIERAGK